MYKLLLCWRYLLTRYLALVCIVSVMLGVATLIVVNSVMSGFSTKLRERLHGLLSDVVIESGYGDFSGFPNPEGKMALIEGDPFLKDRIAAMTPTLEIFAMVQFTTRQGGEVMRPVKLIGIDPEGRARVGGFAEHLVLHRGHPTFQVTGEARERQRLLHESLRLRALELQRRQPGPGVNPDKPLPDPPPATEEPFSPPEGIILGYAIAHYRNPLATAANGQPKDIQALAPGDDVIITTVKGGQKLNPINYRYVLTDYVRTEMSEYDSQLVFVPFKHLQMLRNLEDRATSIQVRLKDYKDAKQVEERLRALFGPYNLMVNTWEEKQTTLLAAIRIEKGILNVLLFLIIAVAGFGILAIFSMIVVEKTRDIGILKALGASNGGVLKIFLGYGLLLGLVGATVGTALGLGLTVYINRIEGFLARLTGMEIFPRDVYYFKEIPTYIDPMSVVLVNLGAVLIAVAFSILPALRAALLHPVRALRYE